MTKQNDKLIEFIANFFNKVPQDIEQDSGPVKGDIEGWDSITHLDLILSIEDEFNVKFSMDNIYEMKDVETIKKHMDSL